MIPKTIHYCWFGRGPKPELALKCIESWKEFCPDYELVEWNEDNFDINSNLYVKQAYEARKFAFVTDYVRLYAMYTQGGIYMDTDVMLLKRLDSYLEGKGFCGFESETKINTGLLAGVKGFPLLKDFLAYYDTARFVKEDGSFDMTTNVEVITELLCQKGLIPNGAYQEVAGMTIYPKNVFCPEHKKLEDLEYMADTATIHYFAGSWKSEKTRKREESRWWKIMIIPGMKISKMMTSLFGEKWTKAKNKIRDRLFAEK